MQGGEAESMGRAPSQAGRGGAALLSGHPLGDSPVGGAGLHIVCHTRCRRTELPVSLGGGGLAPQPFAGLCRRGLFAKIQFQRWPCGACLPAPGQGLLEPPVKSPLAHGGECGWRPSSHIPGASVALGESSVSREPRAATSGVKEPCLPPSGQVLAYSARPSNSAPRRRLFSHGLLVERMQR